MSNLGYLNLFAEITPEKGKLGIVFADADRKACFSQNWLTNDRIERVAN
jgi:hypothetical protein